MIDENNLTELLFNRDEKLIDMINKLRKENEELKKQIEILTSDDDNESVWLEDYNI